MILLENMHHISLGTSNLEKSIRFYCDLFEFEVLEEEANKFAVLRLVNFCIRLNYIPSYTCALQNPGESSMSFILDVDDFTDANTGARRKES